MSAQAQSGPGDGTVNRLRILRRNRLRYQTFALCGYAHNNRQVFEISTYGVMNDLGLGGSPNGYLPRGVVLPFGYS
jgi:hypothetical protein